MSKSKDIEVEELSMEEESSEESSSESSEENSGSFSSQLHIDVNQNKIYQGLCTLLEDEEGNNILQYINLLHTELIGINTSLQNLSSMSKSLETIADVLQKKKSK
jgi:hypothetical protein